MKTRLGLRLEGALADGVRSRCESTGVSVSEWFRGLAEEELGIRAGEDRITRMEKRLQSVEDWKEEMESIRKRRSPVVSGGPPSRNPFNPNREITMIPDGSGE